MDELRADYTTAVIVLAGDPPQGRAARRLRELATAADVLLLAGDGGADALAALQLTPQLIVGDNDSQTAGLFPDVPRLLLPVAKDLTDGEAALRLAAQHCHGAIYLFGALGGRVDHLLTNLALPVRLLDDCRRVTLLDRDTELTYSRGCHTVCGTPGDTVSLIPLTAVHGLSLSGMVYPLADYDLEPGDSRTMSNVLAEPEARISHRDGVLLVVHLCAATQ